MGKKSGSGSGMNNPDHISESLDTIFWVKILKFFSADQGWKKFGSGMEEIRIRDKHPGSATLVETMHTIAKNHEQSCVCKYLGAISKKCVYKTPE
jgi:hypothetical protein